MAKALGYTAHAANSRATWLSSPQIGHPSIPPLHTSLWRLHLQTLDVVLHLHGDVAPRRRAGRTSWGPRRLTVTEAEELVWFGLMAPPGMRLPRGWHLSLGGVPMAPVPDVGTPVMRWAIASYQARLPSYTSVNPHWEGILTQEPQELLTQYDGLGVLHRHNAAGRRAF